MLRAGAEKMQTKYGEGWEQTCPMGRYEFVDAQPAIRVDGVHRSAGTCGFEVRGDDEQVEVTPVIARTCPEPVGDCITPASAMTNLTRACTGENERLNPVELFRRAGLDPDSSRSWPTGCAHGLRNALAGMGGGPMNRVVGDRGALPRACAGRDRRVAASDAGRHRA